MHSFIPVGALLKRSPHSDWASGGSAIVEGTAGTDCASKLVSPTGGSIGHRSVPSRAIQVASSATPVSSSPDMACDTNQAQVADGACCVSRYRPTPTSRHQTKAARLRHPVANRKRYSMHVRPRRNMPVVAQLAGRNLAFPNWPDPGKSAERI